MTKKTVALYGFAEKTREGVKYSKADAFWSIAWAYKYDDLPRIDMLLEIHPIWYQAMSPLPDYQKARDHWEWLKNNREIPVYMLVKHDRVPMSVRYPIESAQALVPPYRRRSVFTSSFDYLMALAVLRGFERIELYGFEMGSDTEYRYQREGAAYWISHCDARGIEVVLPDNSIILKKKMYGYEGGSMIYRQTMEAILAQRKQQRIDAHAVLNGLEGKIFLARQVHGDDSNVVKELNDQWSMQFRMFYIIDGACQQLEKLLAEIDLEEPNDEFIDPHGLVVGMHMEPVEPNT